MSEFENEAVGYRRPPKHSRFRKGQSGNPRGRPRLPGVSSAAEKVLSRKVTATVDGERRQVRLTEAVVLQLAQRALSGDIRASREILRIAEEIEARNPPPSKSTPKGFELRFIDPKDCNPALEALGVIVPVGDRYKIAPWALDAAMLRRPKIKPNDECLITSSTLKPEDRIGHDSKPMSELHTLRPK